MKEKVWKYVIPDGGIVKMLSQELGISEITAGVLVNRGICTVDDAKEYLNPGLDSIPDPFLMKDMDKAARKIWGTVENKRKILVYGDYDVDGITSTALLVEFLKSFGADVEYYIPDRIEDGYGVNIRVIEGLLSKNPSLVITVDCGITALAEASWMKEKGLDLVVTDHHQCGDRIPDACAVVNPCRPDCSYPNKNLAGVGVVFKLVQAMLKILGREADALYYLDLVCLGTVADVMPLIGENRFFIREGLKRLESTERPGLQALIQLAGLGGKPVNTGNIGFGLAPRINAAGRMGSAARSVEMLLTRDAGKGLELARYLDDVNRNRQNMEAEILSQVERSFEEGRFSDGDDVLVLSGDGWHQGVLGIVASRICERFRKPTVLISVDNGIGKGSARSIPGFNLHKALSACSSLLMQFGGHELAAGLTIESGNIPAFSEKINCYAKEYGIREVPETVLIDGILKPEEISIKTAEELEMLEPFGVGNPVPVFAMEQLKIVDLRQVGEGKHLKLRVSVKNAENNENTEIDAIGFNMGELYREIRPGDIREAAFCLEINQWNGNCREQLNLKDLRVTRETAAQRQYSLALEEGYRHWLDRMASSDETAAMCEMAASILKPDSDCYNIRDVDEVEEKLEDCFWNAIIVGSRESLKTFMSILKKLDPAIKNLYEVCYTNSYQQYDNKIPVYVFPDPQPTERMPERVLLVDYYPLFFVEEVLENLLEGAEIWTWDLTGQGNGLSGFYSEIDIGREDLAAVYRGIRSLSAEQRKNLNLLDFSERVKTAGGRSVGYFKTMRALEAFRELNLIKGKWEVSCNAEIELIPQKGKVDLSSSDALKKHQIFVNWIKGMMH